MIRTSSVLVWFGLIIVASLALYRTSDRAHELSMQLHNINTAIEAEQKSIHVLKAEWVYLANPSRLEAVAKKHLALRPTSPQQVTQMSDLSEVLPTRGEAVANVTVSGTPIATIKTSLASLRPHFASFGKPKTKPSVPVATADTGHINDHMIMERTASAQPLPDSIGALIDDLGPHQ